MGMQLVSILSKEEFDFVAKHFPRGEPIKNLQSNLIMETYIETKANGDKSLFEIIQISIHFFISNERHLLHAIMLAL